MHIQGTHSEDFVDQVFHTNDSVLSEGFFNDLVRVDRNTLLVNLGVTTLVDDFLDSLEVGITPRNVGSNPLELTDKYTLNK